MSENVRIEWNGDEVTKEIKDKIGKVIRKRAKKVLDAAKADCPVEQDGDHPGLLRESGGLSSFTKKTAFGTSVVFGSKDAFYAPFVELGTPGTVYKSGETRKGKPRVAIQAKAFMRKSLNQHGDFSEDIEI